ncbi:hypothetical protein [Streptomyces sp. B21-083]|uniref:hypothetical protein n=1 Tax=Streptomyces sp. B21-083 TaxID=3039410 RepID=UPI002FF034F4
MGEVACEVAREGREVANPGLRPPDRPACSAYSASCSSKVMTIMQLALGDWSAEELQQLAGPVHRMVDDFPVYSLDDDGVVGLVEPLPGT